MSKDTKRLVDDIELDLSSRSSAKHARRSVTSLLDLSDEVLLLICRYLSQAYVLYSFYTPERPELGLHRAIFDYYTTIKLDGITNNEYVYLSNLFSYSKHPLCPQSLILSNKHITGLTHRYFSYMPANTDQSMVINLRRLSLIDCSVNDLSAIYFYNINLSQLEYLHITVRKLDENTSMFTIEIASKLDSFSNVN